MTESSAINELQLNSPPSWTDNVRDQLIQEKFSPAEINQALPPHTSSLESFIFNYVTITGATGNLDTLDWIKNSSHGEAVDFTARFTALFEGVIYQPLAHYNDVVNLLKKYQDQSKDPSSFIARRIELRKQQDAATRNHPHTRPIIEKTAP